MTTNLWGEIPSAENIRTPFSVLKEQIPFLEQATNGLLTGRISRETGGEQTVLRLHIVAPALNNYTFEVTQIYHPISLYPLNLFIPRNSSFTECKDEAGLTNALSSVFQSDKIRGVITGLLAQIMSEHK